jgi:hypothetical protein
MVWMVGTLLVEGERSPPTLNCAVTARRFLMTSNDSKITKIQRHFLALSELAPQLNTASDHLTRAVAILDESLKKLNIGLTAWVTFRSRDDDDPYHPERYDDDQIGYCKVNGTWGIALQRTWGHPSEDLYGGDGPWLFNDAPRELRLLSVDKIPELFEALGKAAFDTTKKVSDKTAEVLDLVEVIQGIINESKEKPAVPHTMKALADMAKGVQGSK